MKHLSLRVHIYYEFVCSTLRSICTAVGHSMCMYRDIELVHDSSRLSLIWIELLTHSLIIMSVLIAAELY